MTKRKIKPRKKVAPMKICERCGNGGRTSKATFKCKFCGYINGLESEVVISRGSVDDR